MPMSAGKMLIWLLRIVVPECGSEDEASSLHMTHLVWAT